MTSPHPDRTLLLDAALLGLAAFFWGPQPEGWEPLARGFGDLDAAFAGSEGLPALSALAASFPNNPGSAGEDLSAAHVSLFVNAPGGVPAPLYQSCHEGPERRVLGPSALAMAGRLERAGLEAAANEPADHLCLELAYLRHLLVHGPAGEAAAFARDILPWTGAFRRALLAASPPAPFARAADLLLAVLEELAGA